MCNCTRHCGRTCHYNESFFKLSSGTDKKKIYIYFKKFCQTKQTTWSDIITANHELVILLILVPLRQFPADGMSGAFLFLGANNTSHFIRLKEGKWCLNVAEILYFSTGMYCLCTNHIKMWHVEIRHKVILCKTENSWKM